MNTATSPASGDAMDALGGNGNGKSSGVASAIDLQHHVRTVRKHRLPIIAFTTAVTLLAVFYVYAVTPVYRATATLLIEEQKANIVSIEELYGVDTANEDYYQTQFELLKSRSLAKRVIEDLDLWRDPLLSDVARRAEAARAAENGGGGFLQGALATVEGLVPGASGPGPGAGAANGPDGAMDGATGGAVGPGPEGEPSEADLAIAEAFGEQGAAGVAAEFRPLTKQEEERVVGEYLSRLRVEPLRKTKLVKISFESPDPEQAALIANAVTENYITNDLESKMEMTTKAAQWLAGRVGELKGVLDESEERLFAYKEANGLIDLEGSVGRLNEQELFALNTELGRARAELASYADAMREIRAVEDSPALLESIAEVQADPLVQRVKVSQGEAQRELDNLLNRYGENHPRVVDARTSLATLDATLADAARRVVGKLQNERNLAAQRVASIEAQIDEGKREIQGIGKQKFELDSLQREVETNRNLYNTFFNRMTETASADGLESTNARVSDRAAAPNNPVKPRKQLIVMLAALASLLVSTLMAILYEEMDDAVKNTEDVERGLGLPLLGVLPLIKGGMFSRRRPLPLDPVETAERGGPFKEAVNNARTVICMDDGERRRKVILVTSSTPGEGKSTAALNLCYSLSRMERVLIIDCDMRKPTIGAAAGYGRDAPGLTDVLTRTIKAGKAIRRDAFGGAFDVLPCGPIPEQPLELLSSPRFAKLLELLKEHYDRIVVDCAPLQAASDALVLGRLSDAVVYVVKSHDTSAEFARRAIGRLRQANAPIAGVLVTQVDIDKLATYGGDHYYYGYYDHYGYGGKGGGEGGGKRLSLTSEELMELRSENDDFDLGMGRGSTTAELGIGSGGAARRGEVVSDDGDPTYRYDPFEYDPEVDDDADDETNDRTSAHGPSRVIAAPRPRARDRAPAALARVADGRDANGSDGRRRGTPRRRFADPDRKNDLDVI